MDTLKLAMLKETTAEKLSMFTYLVTTSLLVDNEEFQEFLLEYMDRCISGLTEEDIIEGEV